MNPFSNLFNLGDSARAASGTYDNSSMTRSSQQQPTSSSSGGGFSASRIANLIPGSDPGVLYYDSNLGRIVSPDGLTAQGNPIQDVLGSSTSRSTGGGGGTSAPSYDPNELKMFDQQKSLFERLLQSADSTLGSGMDSLRDSYNQTRNRTNEDRSKALGDYQYNRNQTEQGREKSLNAVGDNSRTLRDSLMRTLGLASGGGSAFDLAGQAVAREATKNRAGVLENYAGNVRGLDRAEEDARDQFQRLLQDLQEQKRTREESLRTGVAQQKQTIQGQLGQLMADRARLVGGDQMSAAEPFRQSYLSLQDKIDRLPDQFRTKVDYNKASLQTPTLKDYMVDRSTIGGQAPGRQQQYSPYANFLQRDNEEEQRLA